MRFYPIFILILTATQSFSQIAKPLEYFTEKYGKHSHIEIGWPALQYHVFKQNDLSIEVTLVDNKAERITYKFPCTNATSRLNGLLADTGYSWTTNMPVSHMELREFQINPTEYGASKLQASKRSVHAYSGTYNWFDEGRYYKLVIVTDKFLKAQAEESINYKAARHNKGYVKANRIQFGFHAKSKKTLFAFFDDWHAESTPFNRESVNAPQIVNAAYDVFEAFYDPTDPKRTGSEKSIYKKCKYIIVQNKLNVGIRKNLDRYHYRRYETPHLLDITINNFCPNLKIKGAKVVYLTEEKERRLNNFLGDEQFDLGHFNIMTPAMARDDSKRRMDYLNKATQVIHGHWEGWHLISHPEVHSILFNKEMTDAVVNFRNGWGGGSASFSKIGNKWEFQTAEETWVE